MPVSATLVQVAPSSVVLNNEAVSLPVAPFRSASAQPSCALTKLIKNGLTLWNEPSCCQVWPPSVVLKKTAVLPSPSGAATQATEAFRKNAGSSPPTAASGAGGVTSCQ